MATVEIGHFHPISLALSRNCPAKICSARKDEAARRRSGAATGFPPRVQVSSGTELDDWVFSAELGSHRAFDTFEYRSDDSPVVHERLGAIIN